MYFYPLNLPKLNLDKVRKICDKKLQITRLYSDEGIYQVHNSKLTRVYFIDDETNANKVPIKINKCDFIRDNTQIKYISSNKIPYNFDKRVIDIYEKGRLRIEVERETIKNIYFDIESMEILGIEDDIKNTMKMICAKV